MWVLRTRSGLLCSPGPGMGSPSPWAPAAHCRLLPPAGLLAQAASAEVLCATQGPWGRVRIPQKVKVKVKAVSAPRFARRIQGRRGLPALRGAAGRGQQSPRPPGGAGACAEGRGRPSPWGTRLTDAVRGLWSPDAREGRAAKAPSPGQNQAAPSLSRAPAGLRGSLADSGPVGAAGLAGAVAGPACRWLPLGWGLPGLRPSHAAFPGSRYTRVLTASSLDASSCSYLLWVYSPFS